jgi:hypothetical protein
MNKLACRYAIVQFMPFVETGEFANVGIVLVCPKSGYFGYQLQTRKYGRITAFFDELQGRIYTESVRAFGQELERIHAFLLAQPESDRTDIIRDTFEHLVHPREAMLRFGEPRAILVDAPEQAVDELFRHYVERDFATPEYVEKTIERRLHTLLKGLHLSFRPERVGNDEIHATFPLVQMRDDVPAKIIKPFNLAQDEPNSIYEHGGHWAQKIARMRRRNLLPEHLLFAVAAPLENDLKRHAAFVEICSELREQNVIVAAANEENRIVEFAQASQA